MYKKVININIKSSLIQAIYTQSEKDFKLNKSEIAKNSKLITAVIDLESEAIEGIEIGFLKKNHGDFLYDLLIKNRDYNVDKILDNHFFGRGIIFPFRGLNGEISSLLKVNEVERNIRFKSTYKVQLTYELLTINNKKIGFYNFENGLVEARKQGKIHITTNPLDVLFLKENGVNNVVAILNKYSLNYIKNKIDEDNLDVIYLSNDLYDLDELLSFLFLEREGDGSFGVVPLPYGSSLVQQALKVGKESSLHLLTAPLTIPLYLENRYGSSHRTINEKIYYFTKFIEYIALENTDLAAKEVIEKYKFNIQRWSNYLRYSGSCLRYFIEDFIAGLNNIEELTERRNYYFLSICHQLICSKNLSRDEPRIKEMMKDLPCEETEIKLFKASYLKELMKKLNDYYSKYRKHNSVDEDLFVKNFPEFKDLFELFRCKKIEEEKTEKFKRLMFRIELYQWFNTFINSAKKVKNTINKNEKMECDECDL